MASATLIPVSEYLATTYRPDRDYVEGVLQERNVGERHHAMMQAALIGIVNANRRQWNVVAGPEQRMEVTPARFRIPDVCILRRSAPVESVVRSTPLVCVEVLSPADTLNSLQQRVDDYLAFGVENIWVIDPVERRSYVASQTGIQEPQGRVFIIKGTQIRITLDDLFAEFDDLMLQC